MKKPEYQPLTPKDMNIQVADQSLSAVVIYDGRVVEESLSLIKQDKTWLMEQLSKRGIKKKFRGIFSHN